MVCSLGRIIPDQAETRGFLLKPDFQFIISLCVFTILLIINPGTLILEFYAQIQLSHLDAVSYNSSSFLCPPPISCQKTAQFYCDFLKRKKTSQTLRIFRKRKSGVPYGYHKSGLKLDSCLQSSLKIVS